MDRSLRYYWFIAILAGIIILFNQLIYIEQLYRHEKTTYVTQRNEWITNAIYDFNMDMIDPKQAVSFNPMTKRLIYVINDQFFRFQLKSKDNIYQIIKQSDYDIQDTSRWTLQHFHSYLQTKRDSNAIEDLPIYFVIEDSVHQIKDSYPPDNTSPQSWKLRMPLGFLTKDMLYASYKDNGMGITPKALKHIFKRYHRGDHQRHEDQWTWTRPVFRTHGCSGTRGLDRGGKRSRNRYNLYRDITYKIKKQDDKQDENPLRGRQ